MSAGGPPDHEMVYFKGKSRVSVSMSLSLVGDESHG